jgi:hypothetical protein
MKALALYGNDWALSELPANVNQFWTREEMLIALRDAGFEGMQAPPSWGEKVRAHGLRYTAHGRVNTPEDIKDFSKIVAEAGARFATLHVGWGQESDDEMNALARAILVAEQKYGIGFWPETHRATMLQDTWRTQRLLERFSELRLNLDVSHYYCAGEFPYRQFAANHEVLVPILQRAACFHGRVSNGQMMQVPLADEAYAENAGHFACLWSEAMLAWKQEAQSMTELAFIPEFGPPSSGYALTIPDTTVPSGRRELTDRWQEMKRLGRLARALYVEQEPRQAIHKFLYDLE